MILIVGAGYMAKEYAKVLQGMGVPFEAVCRTEVNAEGFGSATKAVCHFGGLEDLLVHSAKKYTKAIIATGIESLKQNAELVIGYGIKSVLIEKPAGLNAKEITALNDFANESNASIFVAYNRRFYAGVIKAKEMIEADGGLLSCNFEFTEWAHTIEPLIKAPGVKEGWFLANSTHVVDLAFYFMGLPKQMNCYTSGKLNWHDPVVFAGAGISDQNILFTYAANWISAGRWGLELLTNKRKLIFRPLEKLQEQLLGSVQVNDVLVDYTLDEKYKAGVWLQTAHFVNNDTQLLKSLNNQIEHLKYFKKIVSPILNEI